MKKELLGLFGALAFFKAGAAESDSVFVKCGVILDNADNTAFMNGADQAFGLDSAHNFISSPNDRVLAHIAWDGDKGPQKMMIFSGDSVYSVEVPKGNDVALKVQLPKQPPFYYSYLRNQDGSSEEGFSNQSSPLSVGHNKTQAKAVTAIKAADQKGGSILLNKILINAIANVKAHAKGLGLPTDDQGFKDSDRAKLIASAEKSLKACEELGNASIKALIEAPLKDGDYIDESKPPVMPGQSTPGHTDDK